MEVKWMKLNHNLPVRSRLKWHLSGCIRSFIQVYLMFSPICPLLPPGRFITAAFSSQRGKVHLHREGLTSQVITKPSVRLINSGAIINAGLARTSASKEGA